MSMVHPRLGCNGWPIRNPPLVFTAYASEAGNAMLKWLPTGGFYITGGIAAKNLDRFTPDSGIYERPLAAGDMATVAFHDDSVKIPLLVLVFWDIVFFKVLFEP